MKPFYCPEHKYNPPPNSGFALCPKCEMRTIGGTEMSRYRNEDDVMGIGPDPLDPDLRGCKYPGLHPKECGCPLPHSPNYVFREGVEPVAYQIWRSGGRPDDFDGPICDGCARSPNDREFPLYADDLEAARNKEPICCEACGKVLAQTR